MHGIIIIITAMPSPCNNHEEQVGDNTQVYYEVIPDKIQHTAENRDLDEVSTYSTTKNLNYASSAVVPLTGRDLTAAGVCAHNYEEIDVFHRDIVPPSDQEYKITHCPAYEYTTPL